MSIVKHEVQEQFARHTDNQWSRWLEALEAIATW